MNKKLFFMPLLAALAFTGCSSDEPASSGNGDENDGDVSYIAVNILASNTPGGRGTSDGFESPTEETAYENAAKSAVFLFFDEAGNSTQSPQSMNITWQENSGSTNPQIEKISTATVVIAGQTTPKWMLVVLNPLSTFESYANGKSLKEIREHSVPYNPYSSTQKTYSFVMSNSVYASADGTTEFCATDVSNNKYKDRGEAEKHAVNVYVERVNAKITTTAIVNSNLKGATIKVSKLAGIAAQDEEGQDDRVDYTLTQEITGIQIANSANSSNLIKDITGFTNWDWKTNEGSEKLSWNDYSNKRCYWANTPSITYNNLSWTQIDETDPAKAQKFYVQENTNSGTKTAVIISARLKYENNNFSFVRWGGNYYLKDGFLAHYANILKNANYRIRYYADGTWKFRTIDYENVDGGKKELKWMDKKTHEELMRPATSDEYRFKGYEMSAMCDFTLDESDPSHKESVVILKGGNTFEPVTINLVNRFLQEKQNRCWLWEDGLCYYFANIEHFGPKVNGGSDFSQGVVRNHVYVLNFEGGISGVGTPVFNPEETIIPEKPADDLFYVGAKVNILKWRLVKQTVTITD